MEERKEKERSDDFSLRRHKNLISLIEDTNTLVCRGQVVQVEGLSIISTGLPEAKIGDLVQIEIEKGREKFLPCEVVGFRNEYLVLTPIGTTAGVSQAARVILSKEKLTIPVSPKILGRIINGVGEPLDKRGVLATNHPEVEFRNIEGAPISPIDRRPINKLMETGIRSIDGLISIGCGQRIGIFAGTGVGKSTLLGMISKYTKADVNVICLVGERGREVRDFIEKELGLEKLKNSVVFASTIECSAMEKVYAVGFATSVAEYFSDKGLSVNLYVDSLTRYVRALREIGVYSGEKIAADGFPPKVWHRLGSVLERAGNRKKGSITGFYTVLVESDDLNEPISDNARAMLDGHIILSRKLADLGHYPAIEVTESISRVMNRVITKQHLRQAQEVKSLLSIYKENEDIIQLQAYSTGTNPLIDKSIEKRGDLLKFLRQETEQGSNFSVTKEQLARFSGN